MSNRLPVTFDQNGRELVGYGAPNLPFVNMPNEIAWGGVLTGWLERWRNNSRNQALADYARMVQTLVAIETYKDQLAILTDEANRRNKIISAGLAIRSTLEQLERTARERRELEEIEIVRRAINLAIINEEREVLMKGIADRRRPEEERLSETLQNYRKLVAELETNNEFDAEGKAIMRRQLEALRDKKIVEITGVAVVRAPSPTQSSNTSSAPNRAETVKRRQAHRDADVSSVMNSTMLGDAEKREKVRALHAECEDDCRRIMEG